MYGIRSGLSLSWRSLALLFAPFAVLPAQAQQCGIERWNVKVLQDPDASAVVRAPEPTTISALTGIPRESNRPANGRAQIERRVFRVRGVILEQRAVQADGDIHVVLGDPADRTKFLVAEIPDSACALGSRFASDFAEARRAFDSIPFGSEVEVEGVGFWDDDHGQLGAPPNGIELHPVLSLARVRTSADLAPAGDSAESGSPKDVRVWLNTASRVYHCPGSATFGNTSRGQYMPESAAIRAGGRPAGGRRCQ
jgi:hypothetical protein